MIPQLLTASDLCKALRVSRSNAYKLAEKGVIPSVRFRVQGERDSVRFRAEDVAAFIERCVRGEVAK